MRKLFCGLAMAALAVVGSKADAITYVDYDYSHFVSDGYFWTEGSASQPTYQFGNGWAVNIPSSYFTWNYINSYDYQGYGWATNWYYHEY